MDAGVRQNKSVARAAKLASRSTSRLRLHQSTSKLLPELHNHSARSRTEDVVIMIHDPFC